MLAVFRGAFGRWPFIEPEVSDLDYLRWKISGPATPLGSFQGRLDGRLVYATIVFASWVRLAGVRRLRLSFLDSCVAPAAQGKGIFSRAVAHQDTMRYRCDFSMFERSSAGKVRRRLQGRDQRPLANRVAVSSRILAPLGPRSELGGPARPLVAAGSLAAFTVGSMVARTRPRPAVRPREVTSIDERFDVLFEQAASSFDMIAERTAEFLRWRYGDRRGGRYVIREVAFGQELLGYSVLRTVGPRAYLADLLVLPGREDTLDTLVADAVELATAGGAAMIDCWLPERHAYRPGLRRRGFFRRRRDAGVSFHPVELSADQLAPLEDPRARVHYTLGDTDLV